MECKPNDEKILFQPRSYQQEILDVCINRNTIVYLPTGAGKTHIAIMAVKHFAKDIIIPISEGGKRTVFLVNTVSLAQQQAEYLKQSTNLIIKCFTGDLNVDYWKREKWFREFDENQVIVATCQIIVDIILHGYLSIKNLNLIIFDECHHGRNNHPMHQLMELFENVPKEYQPRVIGLSGMLILAKTKHENVNDELKNLENVFQATIATVSSYDDYKNVLVYATNPEEKNIFYRPMKSTLFIKEIIRLTNNFIDKVIGQWKFSYNNSISPKTLKWRPIKPARFVKRLFHDFLYQLDDTGIHGASISILSILIEFELKKQACDSEDIRVFYRASIAFAEFIRQKLVLKILDNPNATDYSTDKVHEFLGYIKNFTASAAKNNNMKCLVFVQRRYTAKTLYHIMKEHDPEMKVDFLVGNHNEIPESYECIFQQKKNRNILERFRKNELSIIVTTNVLEEGIDLQSCNLVIQFDVPRTFASYIQTKGRVRSKSSEYVLMIPNIKKRVHIATIEEFKLVDSVVKEYLIGKTIKREQPDADDIQEELYDTIIPPYFTPKRAKLTAVSSMAVLYRYAQSLPRDLFTDISLIWERKDIELLKIVTLHPPIQSKWKEVVVSDPYENLLVSKKSAAFKTCVLLHKIGELTDHLMPVSLDRKLEENCKNYFCHWVNPKFALDDKRLSGSKKNKRRYDDVHPAEFTNCLPQLNEVCYLYFIKITPQFAITDDLGIQEVYHNLLSNTDSFGILTTKRLPSQLAAFPLFLTIGQVNVEILKLPIELVVNEKHDMDQLINFHRMIFRDILDIKKNFFTHDNSNIRNSYIIVPTIANLSINWSIVRSYQKLLLPEELSSKAKCKIQFDSSEYLHTVINPSYRQNLKHNYLVTHILGSQTPLSPFPEIQYSNYRDYYEKRYNLLIMNEEQFLVQVTGITTSLNLLNPGMKEDDRVRKLAKRTQQIVFVPELCHNFMFPGALWLKALLLPSILHRLHYLLLAESIRRDMSVILGIEIECSEYMPLEVVEAQSNENEKDAKFAKGAKEMRMETDDTVSNSVTSSHPGVYQSDVDFDRNVNEIVPKILHDYAKFCADFDSALPKGGNSNKKEGAREEQEIISFAEEDKVIPRVSLRSKYQIAILKLDKEGENVTLQQRDILQALTTRASGDIFDQERFEVLGDSFLKFSVSLFVYKNHSDLHEGHLTALKGQIVSNRNLFYCADKFNLGGLIKIDQFQPKVYWLPPLFGLPMNLKTYMSDNNISATALHNLKLTAGQIEDERQLDDAQLLKFILESPQCDNDQDETVKTSANSMLNYVNQQLCGDKTIADTVEALLGVCVKTVGVTKSFNFLSYFNILPDNADNHLPDLMSVQIPCVSFRPDVGAQDIDNLLINYQILEETLGYKFKDRTYLLQAVTHPSYQRNRITDCYQKLEFLGDSVLDFLITLYIYERCGTMDPGKLTDLRAALVNNTTLACITVKYKFYSHLLYDSAALSEKILNFVHYQRRMNHKITDQVYLLIDETDKCDIVDKENNALAEWIDVPKALGDMLESLIGAIFLDSRNNLKVVWKVIYNLMAAEITEFMKNVPIQIVRQLYEFPGAFPKFSEPIVRDLFVIVPLSFTFKNEIVTVKGIGENKHNAKKDAAKIALRKLHGRDN